MGFYADHVVPVLIDLSMRNRLLRPYRQRVVGTAEGRVLEIGIGSGLNLPWYGANVVRVAGLDPSPRLLAKAQEKADRILPPVTFIEGSAEAIPFDDRCFDTVVTTWTLCSIPNASAALAEMRRVLVPTGRLLFVEHGRSPEARVCWWQDRLTPLWKRIGGGCHLNRAIAELIAGAGFRIERLDTGYMKGPKPMTFMYEGSARPR
ncbi:MAG: class I SAM-dependent methyltransferase [Hyphomicrobiaceae bacterium]|nr:MAG: class I SAM-dependent methyltransferase [Hyphomicrobiaceae bacterium]